VILPSLLLAGIILIGGDSVTTSRRQALPSERSVQDTGQRWGDRTFRRRQAAEWAASFRKLDRQVPTLSPEERRWLKTEYDDEISNAGNRYTKRALAATESREYQIRVVAPPIQRLVVELERLADDRALTSREEVALWASVASQFIDSQFWRAADGLVKRKILDSNINGVPGLYFENHALWAQQILAEVVIPFLAGKSK
jgi:hypothetical protein